MYYEPIEKWIWLPKKQYPQNQITNVWPFINDPERSGKYTVAKCECSYCFAKPISSLSIRTSADTFFRLALNGEAIVSGPASAGGDFLVNEKARPQHYATTWTWTDSNASEKSEFGGLEISGLEEGRLDFSAIIRMSTVKMFEYSKGHGGFFLTAHIVFADGEKTIITTDEKWRISLLPAYVSPTEYNASLEPHAPVCAETIENIWRTLDSYIPTMSENRIIPEGGEQIVVPAGQEKDLVLPFDMIYTGYPMVDIQTDSTVRVSLICSEIGEEEEDKWEIYTFTHDDSYIGMCMSSAGRLHVIIKNEGDSDAVLTIAFLASCYPVETKTKAVTTTSDDDLNLVLDVCTHTLQYCRQTLHLDSGRHCEPLACTGDYYIETLMTAFTFGDMRLAEFDVLRTAQLLRYNDGRMYHTTYSLIWVQMLWDVYMLTGNRSLLETCEDAMILLLERFKTYIGGNGLIETPPDYMFIDWLVPDGINMHHPPKALGQTCLNLFYYGALNTAGKIWKVLGEARMSEIQREAADKLHVAIEENLFDAERGVFFEGLNTPTPEYLLNESMPQNVEKRYYRMHANILAAYFGFFDKEKNAEILEIILNDDSFGVVQPYFAHFLLEAVYRNGLRDKYTLKILEDWKAPVKDCPYGLAEGFHKPEPNYSFDHSHAWGGTPAYALPLALSGFEMVEPGFKKIRLNPSLIGLDNAHVQIPTPRGMIEISMKKGEEPEIFYPGDGSFC